MWILIQYAILALSLSMFYMVFSLGLSLVWGLQRVVNFAHGAFFMVGATIGLFTHYATGNFVLSLIVAALAVIPIAVVVERVLLRKFYEADPSTTLLVTFGVSIIIVGITRAIIGGAVRSFPKPSWAATNILVGGAILDVYRISITIMGLIIVLGLYLMLRKTRIGLIVRGGSYKREIIECLGINLEKYFTLNFTIGCIMAALSGVLIAPIFCVSVLMGDSVIVYAFVAIIIGGLGSLKGTIIGSLILGFSLTIGAYFLGALMTFLVFGILGVTLAIFPRGLFGKVGVME